MLLLGRRLIRLLMVHRGFTRCRLKVCNPEFGYVGLSLICAGCRNQSQSYAIESQSFVLHCTGVISEAGIEKMQTKGFPIMGSPNQGSSAVIAPDGRILSAAKTENEQLILADLDLSLVTKAKTFADATGHCKSCLGPFCRSWH